METVYHSEGEILKIVQQFKNKTFAHGQCIYDTNKK